ncbi:imidazole glycerol phosphate synthase subunit HisF [Chitinophagaceae bacterium IBVUCB2]|nr:imidazole glycerol phosphate synthase subunit HisF [Chitinophagaceae bacterium IBVUCB2]
MHRPRLIPVLLLKNRGLVKSIAFKDYTYIGDPINAVKLFNDFQADELIFLDITATQENRLIPLDFVRKVGEEAHMSFAVGGGIKTIGHIRDLINAGSERVIINTAAGLHPGFIREAADTFGSSTIVVSIDVKKDFWKKEKVWLNNGTKAIHGSPVEYAQLMEKNGAGELVIQSINRDGMMNGYDIDLIKKISEAVNIPVVALGGAGNLQHMKEAFEKGHANGLAAGSMFIYQGQKRGVLINYPPISTINFNEWK